MGSAIRKTLSAGVFALALTALAAAPGCSKKESGGGAGAGAEQQATQIWNTRCVACHGARGAGDGPGAAALNPRPPNFHDANWQASVSDEHIDKIVVGGGPAVNKSPLMPPNPDLQGKPEVVAALRKLVRGFAQ